jgi:hypothetical protein
MHADNLERLVEVKFPEDELKEGQYRDYMLIVGGPGNEERMTILEIHDCRPQEQQWSDQVVNVTLQNWVKSGAKYWPLYLYPPSLPRVRQMRQRLPESSRGPMWAIPSPISVKVPFAASPKAGMRCQKRCSRNSSASRAG